MSLARRGSDCDCSAAAVAVGAKQTSYRENEHDPKNQENNLYTQQHQDEEARCQET